jgi:hypothetical protein
LAHSRERSGRRHIPLTRPKNLTGKEVRPAPFLHERLCAPTCFLIHDARFILIRHPKVTKHAVTLLVVASPSSS